MKIRNEGSLVAGIILMCVVDIVFFHASFGVFVNVVESVVESFQHFDGLFSYFLDSFCSCFLSHCNQLRLVLGGDKNGSCLDRSHRMTDRRPAVRNLSRVKKESDTFFVENKKESAE